MTTLNFYNNNPWQSLLNQGLGMLGGNSSAFGVGTFGFGNMGNVSDSYFDQMAAYSVVNSVFSTINQAVSSNQSTRENKNVTYENNKNQIENIDKQIADLNAEKANPKVDTKYDTDIKTAEANVKTADKKVENLQNELKELKEKTGEDGDQTQINTKKAALDKAIEAQTDAENEVKAANQAKTDAKKAKQAEIDEKIKALEAQKAELQADVDNYELDKADGKKLQRTSEDKYNAYLNNNGYVNENGSYTKRDLRTAVNRFMKGLSNSTDKYKAAKNVITIYNRLSSEDKTALLKQAAEIANKYVKEHNEDGSEK